MLTPWWNLCQISCFQIFQTCLGVQSERLCLPNLISLRSRSQTSRRLSGDIVVFLEMFLHWRHLPVAAFLTRRARGWLTPKIWKLPWGLLDLNQEKKRSRKWSQRLVGSSWLSFLQTNLPSQVDKDNSGRLSLDAFMQLMANKMAEKDTKEEIMKVGDQSQTLIQN